MKKILSIEARKIAIILDTTKVLYKYTRAPRQANTRPGKRDNKYFKCLDRTSNRLLLEMLFH